MKNWSDKENEICCEVCVDLYVLQKTNASIKECVNKIKLQPEIANRKYGTIRNKIQNIKYFLDAWNIPNTLKIAGRENGSSRNKEILENILKELGYLGEK